MKTTYEVTESNMDDNIDLVHYFTSVDEAMESGRFDFILDGDDSMTFKSLVSKSDLSSLLKFVSDNYYFFTFKKL